MLKNRIYKYFTIEIFKSFLTILFAFTVIAWTVRAVNFLDLVVDNGHSVKIYFLFSFLNVTNILTKFIPLSFLLALMLSIIKLERQNEFIILWTSGVNKIKIVNLFFLISLIIFSIQIVFSAFITPTALNKSRSLIRLSNFDSLSSVIKINDFSDSFKNLTFYVEEKDSNNNMKNIFIRDESNTFNNLISGEKNSNNTTIIAKSGFISKKKLILFNGVIQTQNDKGELNNINFTKTDLSLNAVTTRSITAPKLQETKTTDLINCIKLKNLEERKKIINCPDQGMNKNIVETLSRRFGMPIYVPFISLICCFLLTSSGGQKSNSSKKYLIFFMGFIILILAEIMVRYSGFSKIHTALYFIIPLIFIPFIYIILLRNFIYEKVKK